MTINNFEHDGSSICYFLTCNRNADYVSFLISSLYRQQDLFYIHCDQKGSENVKKYLSQLENRWNNIIVVDSILYAWAGYSQVEILVRTIERALISKNQWTHFITLSEQHLPLKSPNEIARVLEAGVSTLSFGRVSDYSPGSRTDVEHRFASLYQELPGVGCFAVGPANRPEDFLERIYHGSNWFILARQHCEVILEFDKTPLMKDFRTSVHADESAIHSILGPLEKDIENSSSTLVAEPHLVENSSLIMTDELFYGTINSKNLFIRKRQPTLSDRVKQTIVSNHFFEELHFGQPEDAALSEHSNPASPISLLADKILEEARIFFSQREQDLEIRRIQIGDTSPLLYLAFKRSTFVRSLSVRLLSENLTDFKVVIVNEAGFSGWKSRCTNAFYITTCRARVYDLFGSDEIVPLDMPEGGFLRSQSKSDFSNIFHLVTQMLDSASSYSELEKNGAL